jgi:hypothetical protein
MKLMRLLFAAALCALAASPALADRYRNPIAIFAGLDKITGRIIAFEVSVNETVQFGALQLTPKICYSRPVTEKPQTTTFIEVDEITLQNEAKRLFSGWMFAASPGLNAIEHPVYDVWLTGCKGATERDLIRTPPEEEEVLPNPTAENQLARPLGADGRPQLDPAEAAADQPLDKFRSDPARPAAQHGARCGARFADATLLPAWRRTQPDWKQRHLRQSCGQ